MRMLLVIFLLVSGNVFARNLKKQHNRIKNGVENGSLTKKEAVNLRNEQHELKEERNEIKADGVVTQEEKKEFRHEKAKASRQIYRQKHDKQNRK